MGLGKLGLPCALAIEEKGHDVCGYDIDPRVAEIIASRSLPYREEGAQEKLKRSNIRLVSVKEMVSSSEIIFVPIQTPHDERYEGCTRIPDTRTDFNYSWLKAGIKELNDAVAEQDKDKVVIIISTVLPGTIKTHILPIINGNDRFHLCYNPFFIAMGTAIWDFTHPEFVLFGTESQYAADVTREFYSTIHDSPFYRTDIINAEMIKVCYNTFIGMKIAYANTIMEMCHKNGGNVDEVMNGIKLATERVISPKYLSGGMGDGGGCHPRDNIAMSFIARKLNLSHDFFEDIMKTREDQTEFLAELMLQHDGPYYIMGKTFKEETNLTVGSPAILLYNILREKGLSVTHYDPWIDEASPNFERGTYLVATRHDSFTDFVFPSGSTVIDVWRYLDLRDRDDIEHIKVGIGK